MKKIKCNICNLFTSNIIAHNVFGSKGNHLFFECEECKLAILNPKLSKREEEKFYLSEFEEFMNKRIGDKNKTWNDEDKLKNKNLENIKRRINILKPYLSKNKRILEIGCSSGFMLDVLANKSAECAGIEPSKLFSKLLKKKGYRIYDNLNEILKKRIKFDLILHFFVFEHIVNPIEFINDQINSLNKNGKIIFEIPCYLDPLTKIFKNKAFEKFYWSIAHPFYYTPTSISKLLQKVSPKINFEIIYDQRYDLSNHLYWLLNGKPGGQGHFQFLSTKTINSYKKDLIKNNTFDTMFVIINK